MKFSVRSSRLFLVLSIIFLFGFISTQARAQLDLSPPAMVSAAPGDTITVPLNLTNPNAEAIQAFGLRFLYPSALLEFLNTDNTGTLTDGFVQSSGQESTPGEIVIGGFDFTGTTGSGVLINVIFAVKADAAGSGALQLTNFSDAIAGATTTDGVFSVAETTVFFAMLNGDQEVPAVEAVASGGGMFVLSADQTELSFNLSVRGLSGSIAAAHFHNAAAGSNGSIVRTLTSDFSGEVASGVWTGTDAEPLTPQLVSELLAGNLYVNVHTAANPSGEIRGQVLPGSEMKLAATINGAQEVPPVATSANGAGIFTLDSSGTQVSFDIGVGGLSGAIAAAHFHNASAGVNGGVVRTLTDDFTNNLASGVWSDADSEPLTPALVAELLAGKLYINVHTAANPSGEIRGQVVANAEIVFLSMLNGGQEVPPVDVDGSGGGMFTLSGDHSSLSFNVRVCNLTGEISAAHFHNAATGVNGGVVRAITDDFSGEAASGVWTNADAQPLTFDLVKELIAGNIYVNVHTAANPSGEIRGQVNVGSEMKFSAMLGGNQEVPPVRTMASGAGIFSLNADGSAVSFDLSVGGLSGAIAAAHFHNAPAGVNGGVVRTLTGDFTDNIASGVWTSADAEPLTAALVAELIAGKLYVNVHTAANPSGEIRGQVIKDAEVVFFSMLDGRQEVPPLEVAGSGGGMFVLSGDHASLTFNVRVCNLTGDIAAAHFHNAPRGENGSVVRTITGDFSGEAASGTWTSTDGEPLISDLVRELIAGNLYVNVHTAANPSGEIRGQVLPGRELLFTATINGDQEVPPVETNGNGAGVVRLHAAGTAAEFAVAVNRLSGPIAAAHFHNAQAGQNGSVVRTITDDFVDGLANGTWTNTDAQPLTSSLVAELLAGKLYFNVHTANNPGGEARGQIVKPAPVVFFAMPSGEQEVPAVEGPAAGGGMFVLSPDRSRLQFNVAVHSLSGPIAAAHFHNAPAGENGGVVRTITDDFDGEAAEGIWAREDAEPLTLGLVSELLAGNLYVNVHTAANPSGEIRGQVLLAQETNLAAMISGDQEVPPVEIAASGYSFLSLNDTGTELSFDISVFDLSGPIAAAHFHNAAAGVNGPVVRTLEFTDGTSTGVWANTDAEPLTPALVAELLADKIYLNVHTAANPGGEIRGQVSKNGRVVFMAVLNGAQEVPLVNTGAFGGGFLTLNANQDELAFWVSVTGLSGPIAAAHFHNAAAGQNGGVVRTITDDFDGEMASGTWRPDDAEPLTPALVAELLEGNLYLNAHTAANPSGEIRGQIRLGKPKRFAASLSGNQEVPPVETAGSGIGGFGLSAAGRGLAFNVVGE